MSGKYRIKLAERLQSLTGKHVPALTALVTGVLFLITMTVLLVNGAKEIQENMEDFLGGQFEKIESSVTDVTRSDDSTNRYSAYQMAMANQTEMDGADYSYISGSFLMNMDCDILNESRNCLICTLWNQGETDSRKITMGFLPQNTSDVGAFLWNSDLIRSSADSDQGLTVKGYWKDDIFMTVQISGDYVEYISPVDPPENCALETITVGKDNSDWRHCRIECISKNYGSERFSTVNFVKRWQQVDKLMKEFRPYALPLAEMQEYRMDSGGLFSFRTMRIVPVVDPYGASGNIRMLLAYCTSFSPLGLAAKELLMNGTMLTLLCIFFAAGFLLASGAGILRKREIQGFQDEFQRQKKALDYAQNAEAARREMTSAIAHELKTPIAVLSSYAEALQENIDAEKQSYYLGVIREETERMDRMVLELLDLSRLEEGRYKLRRESFDLEELVREILRPIESSIQEKQLTLEWQIGERETNADRYRFGQVVENYLTNAIAHTPQGGKIVLRIGMNRETFSVENQGRNIPTDQLNKVWETFWQGDSSRNKRGSGLGLAICRSVMMLHGGNCKVENTASGVRFTANISNVRNGGVVTSMLREDVVELSYPIAQEYTTVERVFLRLRLLDSIGLHREIRANNIQCGNLVVKSATDHLYPGYVICWEDFRITITVDTRLKQQALLVNQFQPVGRLSNFPASSGAGHFVR